MTLIFFLFDIYYQKYPTNTKSRIIDEISSVLGVRRELFKLMSNRPMGEKPSILFTLPSIALTIFYILQDIFKSHFIDILTLFPRPIPIDRLTLLSNIKLRSLFVSIYISWFTIFQFFCNVMCIFKFHC